MAVEKPEGCRKVMPDGMREFGRRAIQKP